MQFIKLLRKPHPFIFNHWSVIIPGLITLLIIGLFSPFKFQYVSLKMRWGFAFMIGIIISISVWSIVSILKKLFPSLVEEENWTILKEILLFTGIITALVCIIFLLILGLTQNNSEKLKILFEVFFYTITISIFPITILILFEQYNHQKKQLIKAKELSEAIPKQENSTKSTSILLLKAENGKIELQLSEEQILYLKSDRNYVEVIYLNGTSQKKLIRNRLKSLGEMLPESSFFQCHKSYIVNIRNIVRVEGNARNFELFLKEIDIPIPVSRAKSEELQQRISPSR